MDKHLRQALENITAIKQEPARRKKYETQLIRLLKAHSFFYEKLRQKSTDPKAKKFAPFIDSYIRFLRATFKDKEESRLDEYQQLISEGETDKSLVHYYMSHYPIHGKWLSFLSYFDSKVDKPADKLFRLYASRFEEFLMHDLQSKASDVKALLMMHNYASQIDGKFRIFKRDKILQLMCYFKETLGFDYVCFALTEMEAFSGEGVGYSYWKDSTQDKHSDTKESQQFSEMLSEIKECFVVEDTTKNKLQEHQFQTKWQTSPFAPLHTFMDYITSSAFQDEIQLARDATELEYKKFAKDTKGSIVGSRLESYKTMMFSEDAESSVKKVAIKILNFRAFYKLKEEQPFEDLPLIDLHLYNLALDFEKKPDLILAVNDETVSLIDPTQKKLSDLLQDIPDKKNVESFFHSAFKTEALLDLLRDYFDESMGLQLRFKYKVQRLWKKTPQTKKNQRLLIENYQHPQDILKSIFKFKRSNLYDAVFTSAFLLSTKKAADGNMTGASDMVYLNTLFCTQILFKEKMSSLGCILVANNKCSSKNFQEISSAIDKKHLALIQQHIEAHSQAIIELSVVIEEAKKAA